MTISPPYTVRPLTHSPTQRLFLHSSEIPPPCRHQVRDWLVPVNKRYNLSALLSCLTELFPRRSVSDPVVLIEYIMLRGINDSEADARRCATPIYHWATGPKQSCCRAFEFLSGSFLSVMHVC